MTNDLQALLSEVDPAVVGKRVRAARAAAAIPVPELCRVTGVGATTLDEIEGGLRLPELPVLAAIAASTDTTAEYLVTGLTRETIDELQGSLDHAAFTLSATSSSDARSVADRVLEQLELAEATAPHLRLAAQRLRATAHEASGELTDAISDLRLITAEPRREAQWLKDLIALCRCYRESGQLDAAIAVGEEAAPTIRELDLEGVTEAVQLTATVASAYIFRAATGDLGYASRLCLRAADEADRHGLPIAKASALWNASVAKYAAGDVVASLSLGRQALALFGEQGDIRNLGVLHMQMGNAYLVQDPPDALAALEMLTLAGTELTMAGASAVELARHRQVLARAHLELGDGDKARALLAESDALAPDNAVELRAWHYVLLATLDARERDFRSAHAHVERAVQMLSASGADGDAAQVWFRVASVFAELDEMELAADAYRRAAVAQGLRPNI